ncbi:MAG: sigma-70 family RNA polymerase sigma factor [Salinisphaeraceae bacterium]|nr:sigma-70 family RNA polymerase sigma factor [Salinisphaeraceae bacterium]
MQPEFTQQQLLEALRDGSDAAAEQLVREHASWMRSLAISMLHDADAADDCVQDAFINAFRHINKFRSDSTLKTWLHRIVVNTALMRLRKTKRLKEQPIDELQPEYNAADMRINEPRQPIKSPDKILENADLRQQVLAAISQLPESYRIVLLLRDIEELSTAEVADRLRISQANTKVRLHRGRAALKKLLEPVLHSVAGPEDEISS